MNYRTAINKKTTRTLIKDATELWEMINKVECFRSKEVLLLEFVLRELERRGYAVSEKKNLVIKKGGTKV